MPRAGSFHCEAERTFLGRTALARVALTFMTDDLVAQLGSSSNFDRLRWAFPMSLFLANLNC
jgi:hypothetical protein